MNSRIAGLLASLALAVVGCKSECQSACEDWSDTCGFAWGYEPADCEQLCEHYSVKGTDDGWAACYSCFSRHAELCTPEGSEAVQGQPCYNTCNIDD